MKILFFVLVLTGFSSIGQTNCKDVEIYNNSLKQFALNRNKPIVVEFNYEFDPFIKEIVDSTDVFSTREKQIINETLSSSLEGLKLCDSLKLKLVEMGMLINDDHLNEYTLLRYATPVHISANKVFLFVDVFHKKKNRKRSAGGSIVEVYEKEKNRWRLTKNIALAVY